LRALMTEVTICDDPACGTSRDVMGLTRSGAHS
jgi:hypothetical protein